MVSIAVFCSNFSFTWHGNKILDQRTSCVKLTFEIWKFKTIVCSPLIKIVLDVERIFSRLEETESTIENIWVKYLSYDSIDHSHAKRLMLQISLTLRITIILGSKERPVIHFKNHF